MLTLGPSFRVPISSLFCFIAVNVIDPCQPDAVELVSGGKPLPEQHAEGSDERTKAFKEECVGRTREARPLKSGQDDQFTRAWPGSEVMEEKLLSHGHISLLETHFFPSLFCQSNGTEKYFLPQTKR